VIDLQGIEAAGLDVHLCDSVSKLHVDFRELRFEVVGVESARAGVLSEQCSPCLRELRGNKRGSVITDSGHIDSFRAGFDNRTMTEAGEVHNLSGGGVPA
jgi:hypothetical protein